MRLSKSDGAKKLSFFAVVCLSIMIMLSTIGIGYSYWQNSIKVTNSISTGNMDVTISECKILCEKVADKNKRNVASSVKLGDNKKVMNVELKGVYPGYSVAVSYRIKNNGSIPVKCRLVSTYDVVSNRDSDSKTTSQITPSEVTPSKENNVIIGAGESKEGIMIVSINNVVEGEKYNIPIYLVFDQYNELD